MTAIALLTGAIVVMLFRSIDSNQLACQWLVWSDRVGYDVEDLFAARVKPFWTLFKFANHHVD